MYQKHNFIPKQTLSAAIMNEIEAGIIKNETDINSLKNVTDNLTLTLPHGGSKEWLEDNGDTTQLYQIDGYVWAYIDGTGWTRSGTQFNVVSNESQMTNEGGTPYLLRSGNSGTVYSYTAASGDAGVPVYDKLPETASEGDVVAVGGRKYKASLTTKEVPNFTNLADPASSDWVTGYRINSSNGLSEASNMTTTNYIPCAKNDVLRISGIGNGFTSTTGSQRLMLVDSSKTHIITGYPSNSYSTNSATSSFKELIAYENGVYSYNVGVIGGGSMVSKNVGYARICYLNTNIDPADVIVTVNQEITYTTKKIIDWTDIGEYIPPIEAGWNATVETQNVIDSLSSTSTNGTTAVYSVDGYKYTYLSGADWMQTSKYSVPTFIVDGELSDTSTNAIENRAVKGAIDSVRNTTNSISNEVNALNTKIAKIETGSTTVTIPAFWQNAVDEVIAKIKALQVGRNCVTFPFFSDNHQRNGYAGILISHIMKECHIPYCFFGGDSISNGYIDSEETMIAQDKAFDTIMSYIPNGRFCRAVGNHDGFWNVSSATGDEYHYTRDKVYELFLREESVAQNKHFGSDGTYYYVNDLASKTRFIILNTNGIKGEDGKVIGDTFDTTQLSWLQNTALKFNEPGWAVVLFSHQPISNHYHAGINNAAAVRTVISNYINSNDVNNGDIVGWFSGHIHRDRIYTGVAVNTSNDLQGTDMGFTQVTITSDATAIAYDDTTKHPQTSDDKSHAIDFVTINKDTRIVNLTRLGVGVDRSYTY